MNVNRVPLVILEICDNHQQMVFQVCLAVRDGSWTAQVCRDSGVPVTVGAALGLRKAACGLFLLLVQGEVCGSSDGDWQTLSSEWAPATNAMSPRDTSALCPGTGIKVKGPCAL